MNCQVGDLREAATTSRSWPGATDGLAKLASDPADAGAAIDTVAADASDPEGLRATLTLLYASTGALASARSASTAAVAASRAAPTAIRVICQPGIPPRAERRRCNWLRFWPAGCGRPRA